MRFLRWTPAALATVRMSATHQGTVRAVATMTTAATVRGSSSLDLRRADGCETARCRSWRSGRRGPPRSSQAGCCGAEAPGSERAKGRDEGTGGREGAATGFGTVGLRGAAAGFEEAAGSGVLAAGR